MTSASHPGTSSTGLFLSQQLGQEEAIPFSNSLAVSDYSRIEQADYHNRDKYRFGQSGHITRVRSIDVSMTFQREYPDGQSVHWFIDHHSRQRVSLILRWSDQCSASVRLPFPEYKPDPK